MHSEISSYEAQIHLPELLRQVRRGKSYTITHRGKAVAELVPVHHANDKQAALAVQPMKTFMRTHRIPGVNIKALIE